MWKLPWKDADRAGEAIGRAATLMGDDPAWADALLDPPRVIGIEKFAGGAVTLRIVARVDPYRRDDVARNLRARIRESFNQGGISTYIPPAPPVA